MVAKFNIVHFIYVDKFAVEVVGSDGHYLSLNNRTGEIVLTKKDTEYMMMLSKELCKKMIARYCRQDHMEVAEVVE